MLHVLDKMLEGLFAFGIPLVFTLWAIGFTSLALLNLFSDALLFEKAELLGLAVCHACTCYWFWIWKAQMAAGGNPEGFSHVPATLALFISVIVLVIPVVLRACLIPFCVSGVVYLGIAIFGL